MEKVIWKYELKLVDVVQSIEMPVNARILHVGLQNRKPCLWVEVDKTAAFEARFFKVYGTGHDIRRSTLKYLGTAIDDAFALVWHVYGD